MITVRVPANCVARLWLGWKVSSESVSWLGRAGLPRPVLENQQPKSSWGKPALPDHETIQLEFKDVS